MVQVTQCQNGSSSYIIWRQLCLHWLEKRIKSVSVKVISWWSKDFVLDFMPFPFLKREMIKQDVSTGCVLFKTNKMQCLF